MMRYDGGNISVCLLSFNHAHVIESTIRSVLEQHCDGFEFIVSDDCSTDGTWERIQELACHDPRIRPIRTPRNMGMPGNANYAVAASLRPYIALLHHDDIYRPDLLARWARILDEHPAVGFVFNAYAVSGRDVIYTQPLPAGATDGRWFLRKYLLPRWGCPVRGTAMIRRTHWVEVGGMREQFNLLADIDLWMRLTRVSDVGYVPEPLIAVRSQPPEDYPEAYKAQGWSWSRQCYLYKIHGTNRLETRDLGRLLDRLGWWIFRVRVSRETCKWLGYAMVRRKSQMILSSPEGATVYDLLPVGWVRALLVRWYRWREAGSLASNPNLSSTK